MPDNILFSIIIPTYNRADFIAKTIQSLLVQTYQNFEIIVVDDGSTDNTEEVVLSIKDTRISYYKKENAERGAARNYGAARAKGDYVNFFDSDDLAYSNHLQEALNVIEKNINPVVIALSYDIKNTTQKTTQKTPVFNNINIQLIKGNVLSCNGVFIKKENSLEFKFSETRALSASEDYLLWLQLASQFKIRYSNVKTSTIVDHDARSVISIKKEELIQRKNLMLSSALNDSKITQYYGRKVCFLTENTFSYIALHLMLADYKKEGINYFIKALKARPTFLFSRRAMAIIKHFIF